MAAQLNIVIRTHTSVTKIDTANHKVFVGEETDQLQQIGIGVGAEAIRPRMEGDGADRVFSINDLEDYASFRAIVDGKKRVLIWAQA